MKDGDIFRWRWKGERDQPGDWGAYHCRSQIAVVGENGVPYDTYWSDQSRSLNPEDIETKYLGNVHEMSKISSHEVDYYRPEDVVDMRHSNSTTAPIYLKPGAMRDAETMRAHVKYRIERSEGDIQTAESRIRWLNEAITKIDAGNLDEVYL